MMNFEYTSEFEKEKKLLTRKCRSLDQDLVNAERVIGALYTDQESVDSGALREKYFNGKNATVLTANDNYQVVKMRVDCAAQGSRQSLRLVFVFDRINRSITFIELFSKTDKSREDQKRMLRYMKAT